MNAELAYRFCVREKPAAEQVSRSRPLFITHEHMREADAADRYEVVERLVTFTDAHGIDARDAFLATAERVLARNWTANPITGVATP